MSYIVFSNFVHEVIFWKEIYLFPIYFYTLIFIYFSIHSDKYHSIAGCEVRVGNLVLQVLYRVTLEAENKIHINI